MLKKLQISLIYCDHAHRKDKATVRKSGSTFERIRFKTSAPNVTVIFRKKNVTDADISEALDEASAKIRNQGSERSE